MKRSYRIVIVFILFITATAVASPAGPSWADSQCNPLGDPNCVGSPKTACLVHHDPILMDSAIRVSWTGTVMCGGPIKPGDSVEVNWTLEVVVLEQQAVVYAPPVYTGTKFLSKDNPSRNSVSGYWDCNQTPGVFTQVRITATASLVDPSQGADAGPISLIAYCN